MLDYSQFINEKFEFYPRIIVKIGGEDVSDRYVEGSLRTDGVLDTPTLNVWTTASAFFLLDNSDNHFNSKNEDNFFSDLDRPLNGWETHVSISVLFENDDDAPTTPKTIFTGLIESVVERPEARQVLIRVLDASSYLGRATLENFGRAVSVQLVGPADALNYSASVPVYDLPVGSTPVSYRSVKASIGDEDLTVLDSLPEDGIFGNYRYLGVDYADGKLYFGGEPPNQDKTRLSVDYKSVFRYRTPEALIFEMLEHVNVYDYLSDTEKMFAKSFLKSSVLESMVPRVSSHGRPAFSRISPVVRWIESELGSAGSEFPVFYFGADTHLFRYRRRDEATGILDTYDRLSSCPDFDANIIQFLKVGEIFYVLTSQSYSGRLDQDENNNPVIGAKLWSVDLSRTPVWVEISNADPTVAQFYDHTTQSDPVSDNRKSFLESGGNIYYVFGNNSTGAVRNGIRRYRSAQNDIELVDSGGITSDFGWDFVIDESSDKPLFAFECQRSLTSVSYLRVREMELDGSGKNLIYVEEWASSSRYRPVSASDIVKSGNDFYFVLTYSRREGREGFSELCWLQQQSDDSYLRFVLKRYERTRDSARSLTVHREPRNDDLDTTVEHIYFVEGNWISGIEFLTEPYPTFDQTGHLARITPATGAQVEDLGPIWRSRRDLQDPGRGMHTACPSNIHSSLDGSIHFIAGYGFPVNPLTDSIQSLNNDPEVQTPDNWVWLQYGKKLSTKVPVFPTNGKQVWPLIEELARVVDYEVGWVPGDREIVDFLATYPHLTLESKGYLFFRPRGDSVFDVSIDESMYVNLGSELDTVQVFNNVSMSFGGHIWFEPPLEALLTDARERVRNYHIFTDCLTGKDSAWAEVVCKRVLQRQREPRLKTELPLKFSPHLQLGDLIRLTSEYHSLDETRYRLTAIAHHTSVWQTRIECREDLEMPVILDLPFIEDREVMINENVENTLPAAVGGTEPYMYELYSTNAEDESLPAGFSFDSEPYLNDDETMPNPNFRKYSGRPTPGVYLLTYQVADDDGAVAMRFFTVTVVSAPLALPDIDLVHIRKDCYQKYKLPVATGGSGPYSYELGRNLVQSLDFDSVEREIIGLADFMASGDQTFTQVVDYEVRDTSGADVEESVRMVVEPHGEWSGLYFVSGKVGVLDNNRNWLREYDYSTKTREITISDGTRSGDLSLMAGGNWTGCCAVGTYRIFVDNENNKGVYYNGNMKQTPDVDLGDGDWRDVVALSSTVVAFFDFETAKFYAYSVAGARVEASDIQLEYVVDIVSAVVVSADDRIYSVVRGSDQLVAWRLSTDTTDPSEYSKGDLALVSDFKFTVEGITDWEAVEWTGTHFLLLRPDATRLVAVEAAGERSVENDLQLYGDPTDFE